MEIFTQPVGFIGLGNMGGFMAQNILKAGYPLVVFDVNKGAVERLTSQGAKAAATPREVASQVHQLVTMLPSSPHVQEVYTSENGIFNGIKEGSLLIDASTIEPAVARGVIAKASEHKVTMVDAPVSGGTLTELQDWRSHSLTAEPFPFCRRGWCREGHAYVHGWRFPGGVRPRQASALGHGMPFPVHIRLV